MTRVMLALIAVLLGWSCDRVCLVKCPDLQQIVFEDTLGNPLTPLEVTVNQTTHRCEVDGGVSGEWVSCSGNTLMYDEPNSQPHTLQARATTGEVFSGEITPVPLPAKPPPPNTCGCSSSSAMEPITVKLSAP